MTNTSKEQERAQGSDEEGGMFREERIMICAYGLDECRGTRGQYSKVRRKPGLVTCCFTANSET